MGFLKCRNSSWRTTACILGLAAATVVSAGCAAKDSSRENSTTAVEANRSSATGPLGSSGSEGDLRSEAEQHATALSREAEISLGDESAGSGRTEALLSAALANDPANASALALLEGILKKQLDTALAAQNWEDAILQCSKYGNAIQNAISGSGTVQAVDNALAHRAMLSTWLDEILAAKENQANKAIEDCTAMLVDDSIAGDEMIALASRSIDELELLMDDPDLAPLQGDIRAAREQCIARRFNVVLDAINADHAQILNKLDTTRDSASLIILGESLDSLADDLAEVFDDAVGAADRLRLAHETEDAIGETRKRLQRALQLVLSEEGEKAADNRASVHLRNALLRFNDVVTVLWVKKGLPWQKILDELGQVEQDLSRIQPGISAKLQDQVFGLRRSVLTRVAEARAGQLVNYNKWAIRLIEEVRADCVKALNESGEAEDQGIVDALVKLGRIDMTAIHPAVSVLYNEVFGKYYAEIDDKYKPDLLTRLVTEEKRPASTD